MLNFLSNNSSIELVKFHAHFFVVVVVPQISHIIQYFWVHGKKWPINNTIDTMVNGNGTSNVCYVSYKVSGDNVQ